MDMEQHSDYTSPSPESVSAGLKSILLVDDDEVSNFLSDIIIRDTITIEEINTCMNGQEALDFLDRNLKTPSGLPDVIFLDLNMPVMDGWDFLKEYRKMAGSLGRKPLVFILSSSVYREDIEYSRKFEEVSGFLTKPLTPEQVISIKNQYFPAGSSKGGF
jgi:CheY-like chemotaxis protein